MKLRSALTLLGLGIGAMTVAVNQGCGDSESDGGTTSQEGRVPPKPEGSPTTSTEERTFAVNSIFLGETDRSGNRNKDAWKTYGYNLDGRITNVANANSPDLNSVCKRVEGAAATVHQDGDDGIDNSFGKTILNDLLTNFLSTPSKTLSDAINDGSFTIMLKVKGLTDEPEQTNTDLSATLLVGGSFSDDPNVKPTFSTSDDWPFLKDPQIPISGAYINKGVFVNGTGGASVKLTLSIGGQALSLTINKAIITFKHNPSTKSLEEGTIAGIINTNELIEGIGSVAGRFSTDLCEGSVVEGIKESIRQASDILSDGTQDPSRTCDAISVGIGFTAKQVANPTKETEPGEVPPDPCQGGGGGGGDQDAGADAGGDPDAGDEG